MAEGVRMKLLVIGSPREVKVSHEGLVLDKILTQGMTKEKSAEMVMTNFIAWHQHACLISIQSLKRIQLLLGISLDGVRKQYVHKHTWVKIFKINLNSEFWDWFSK